MKKWVIAVVLMLVGGVLYQSTTRYGVALGPLRFSLAPDKQSVELAMRRFLEDVQFKDFQHAATFHSEEDRKTRNIPQLIENKFAVKPELLDIRSFDVLRVDVMSTGTRARVYVKVFAKILNGEDKVRELEAVFFFKRSGDGPWFMDLQSSL